MLKNTLTIALLVPAFAFAQAEVTPEVSPEVSIKAKSLKLHDEVSYTPHSVVIEQPATDVDLGETLAKLPGVLVRSTSGFGSATTVITSQALGSGGTAVSIDDIPVIETSGRGVNFTLFPGSLFSSVEHHSPFYPSLDPTADTLPAAGGRINLRTLKPVKRGELPWSGSLLFGFPSNPHYGPGTTFEGSGAYRHSDDKQDLIVGVSGFNTNGDFHYKEPRSGASRFRDNNDANGSGGLVKYRRRLGSTGTLDALELIAREDRTNPGSINSPSRDHQRDLYNLLGVRYADPEALGKRNGLFGKLAGAYSRTATRKALIFGSDTDSTDSRSFGQYVQGGFAHRDRALGFTLGLDNQYDYLRGDEGVFNRNVFGATGTLSVDLGKVRLVPLGRVDASSKFPAAGDGSLSLIWSPDAEDDLALSYGLQHSYPTITSSAGFTNSGLTLLSNPDLRIQRDSIVSLSYSRRESWYTLYSTAFYDLIRNRSTFTFLSDTTAQFVNASEVSVLGYALDAQVFVGERLSVRGSVSLARAWDRATGHEMPYKPRVESWGAVNYLITKKLGVTVQEQFLGKRFTSVRGVDTISPFAQTILRFDLNVWRGVAFMKISNLFDASGFENPGFPVQGRSIWLGYTLQ